MNEGSIMEQIGAIREGVVYPFSSQDGSNSRPVYAATAPLIIEQKRESFMKERRAYTRT